MGTGLPNVYKSVGDSCVRAITSSNVANSYTSLPRHRFRVSVSEGLASGSASELGLPNRERMRFGNPCRGAPLPLRRIVSRLEPSGRLADDGDAAEPGSQIAVVGGLGTLFRGLKDPL